MNRMILAAMTAALLSSGALAKSQTIYSPDQGVLCDRKSGFCADTTGISMAFTDMFLGKKAAAKLLKVMGSDADESVFTMSNGVHCEMKAKKCTTSKWNDTPDPVANGVLFKQ